MSLFKKRLERLMAQRRMTVKQLVDECNISRAYLYRVLGDEVDPKTLSLGMIEEIAKGLRVSVVELLQDPGAKEIEEMRHRLSEEDHAIIDAIETLDVNDKRRKAILQLLRVVLKED